jgi:hypothetical protein
MARPCQGDAVKKGITFELAVMPRVLLVVAIVVVSIVSTSKGLRFGIHQLKGKLNL